MSILGQANSIIDTITDQEVFEYFKSMDEYPKCKIQEFMTNRRQSRLKKWYQPIASKRQLKALVSIADREASGYLRYYGINIAYRMLVLLSRNNTLGQLVKIINKIKSSKDDDEVYAYLRNNLMMRGRQRVRQKGGSGKNTYFLNRERMCSPIELFGQQFKYFITKYQRKFNKYLDVGCGNGRKAVQLGRKLGIAKDKIYGIDIPSFDEQDDWGRDKSITFKAIKESEPYPFPDAHFSLITVIMVLHHVKDLKHTLREIYRVLEPGGILVIKEHDCFNYADVMLADVEHCMYNLVYAKKVNRNFRCKGYATYYNWIYWDMILRKFGFQYLEGNYMSSSINFHISASRAFYSVYQKQDNVLKK